MSSSKREGKRDLIAQAKRADLKIAYQTSASRASSTQSNTEGLAVYQDNVQNFINVNEDPYTICKPDNEERQVEALVNPLPPSSAVPHSEHPGEIPDKYFEQPAGGAEDQQFLEDLQWADGLLEDHDPLVNLQEDLEDDQKQ
nr:hypothetical protein CFP56_28367 [Quercus suber]